jgi:hypothetical protein
MKEVKIFKEHKEHRQRQPKDNIVKDVVGAVIGLAVLGAAVNIIKK